MLLLFVFIASLAATIAAVLLPGWSDLLLLAGPCAIASAILLLSGRRRRSAPDWPMRNGADPKGARWVVLDGSNVMHWKDGTPQIDTVIMVLHHLKAAGYSPGVVFDANAGYLLSGRYRHDGDLGKALGLRQDRVMVVPKGTPADPYILTAARDMGAAIVTNDRFRDWVDDFPELHCKTHLIRGGFRDGTLWLDLPAAATGAETRPARPQRSA